MLDLSQRDDLRWLAQVLADVHAAAPRAETLLVGAMARDLLLHYGHGIPLARATEDVDLAIAIEDWDQFVSIRDALLRDGRFAHHKAVLHRLRHHQYGWIDLVPFGAVEQPDRTIAWPPRGDEVMNVLGYREANTSATRVVLPHGQAVQVVSLPMLAVLKLLAWKDRHLIAPMKDAVDLMLILDKYFEAGNADRLSTELTHLLTDDFDFARTGAWLAGTDARNALHLRSADAQIVIRAMTRALATELQADGPLTLVAQMSAANPEHALRLLIAFHRGLIGAATPWAAAP